MYIFVVAIWNLNGRGEKIHTLWGWSFKKWHTARPQSSYNFEGPFYFWVCKTALFIYVHILSSCHQRPRYIANFLFYKFSNLSHKQQKKAMKEEKFCMLILLHSLYFHTLHIYILPTSKPKNIYFLCQIKWLKIFLVMSFSYRQHNLTWKVNLCKPFTWKISFNSLRNCKET